MTTSENVQAKLDLLSEINQIFRAHPTPSILKALAMSMCSLIDQEITADDFLTDLATNLNLIANGAE
jgi:hypothetical protein